MVDELFIYDPSSLIKVCKACAYLKTIESGTSQAHVHFVTRYVGFFILFRNYYNSSNY